MKKRRLCIVACLVICLVGYNIKGTFGMEETATLPTDGSEAIDPTTPAADGSGDINTAPPSTDGSGDINTAPPATDGSGDINTAPPATDGSGDINTAPPATDGSGDINTAPPATDGSGDTNTAPPATDGSGDNGTTTPPTDDSGDNGTTTPPTDDSGDNGTTTPPTDDSGDNGTTTPPTDDSGDNGTTTPPTDDSEEIAPELPPEEPQVTDPVEEIPAKNNDDVIYDRSPDAVYLGGYYNKSGAFLDTRYKTKYNAALPIEGLPSFITQDMIIGALKCQDLTGFPASVTIAQIIQESGFGIYGPNGENGQGLSYLAYQYNNLFGIKGSGSAGSVSMRTGEQTVDGESYMTTADFRAYNTYTECIEDRTQLLQEVYSDLTADAGDANTFAMNIGGRWATDIQYGQSLIHQMETYDLYRLDRMTLLQFNEMIGTFADPCPGATLTSTFGYREFRDSYHQGIDLGTGSENIPTYAADAGTVVTAGYSDSAGNWIVIDHENGLVTKYMHHDVIYVTEGQYVEKGQQLGLSGTTGDSTGNHLHFQVEENGISVDPAPYLGMTE